ncbi:MAG: class II glutamine amidotransferase [Polyangiaceae bacterium]|nr:class II glutamine amidotransferase [Polyangiaceae bacterium]
MCRMLGVVAQAPVSLEALLSTAPRSLGALSREHRDGWGVAASAGQGWRVHRRVECAGESPVFREEARTERAAVAIAHVRQRTVGPVSLANTHPFERGGWVLAHNGTVDDVPGLVAMCSPARAAEVEGDTDSERLFAFLLTCLDAAPGDAEHGLATAARRLACFAGRGAVNFLLSDGDRMFAHRSGRSLFVLERGEGEGRRTASVTFASEPLTTERWRELPQGSLWRATRLGGASAPRACELGEPSPTERPSALTVVSC